MACGVAVAAVCFGVSVPSASAASTVTARGVALAPSASCRYGDIDVSYAATGAERQNVQFSSETVILNQFEVAAFKANYDGVEHILSLANPPFPADGSVLTVYVTIGTTPPTAATTAEFVLTYRCTASGNENGGSNVVVSSCFGAFGTCSRANAPAAVPRFTG